MCLTFTGRRHTILFTERNREPVSESHRRLPVLRYPLAGVRLVLVQGEKSTNCVNMYVLFVQKPAKQNFITSKKYRNYSRVTFAVGKCVRVVFNVTSFR